MDVPLSRLPGSPSPPHKAAEGVTVVVSWGHDQLPSEWLYNKSVSCPHYGGQTPETQLQWPRHPWPVATSLQALPSLSNVLCVPHSVFLQGHLSQDLGPTPIRTILSFVTPAKILFPNKVMFTGSRCDLSFEGTPFIPQHDPK